MAILMKKVCVIGHFGGTKTLLNGQTVKTKIVTGELKRQLGENEVMTIDTCGGAKALLKCFILSGKALKEYENAVMFPAHNGVRFFAPVLLFWNMLFHRKLHYVVIGGWLPKLLADKPALKRQLQKFSGIYVETATMKKALEEIGFENIFVMPNCKELTVLKPEDMTQFTEEPYNLCTFSRVMREKGIEDAVKAVTEINERAGRTVYALDIYGQVDSEQAEWFEELKNAFPEFVRYGGLVPFDESVEVLKDYFALLFPTRFFTEGVPGTIIDGYAAGVPVISARWESFGDVVDDGSVGIGYDFDSYEDFVKTLEDISKNPEAVINMKENCLKKAEEFSVPQTVKRLIDNLD